MPQAVSPGSAPQTPDNPPPLRRRRAAIAPVPSWPARMLRYALAFAAIVLVVDSLVGTNGLMDTLRARQQYAALSADLNQKRSEDARLRDDIRRLREDPRTIEAIARQELGLMRQGEVLVILHDVK
ncbi:MAG: FtsB family cell division protein, partial [Vicinamibacterales bacterium]